MNRFWDFQGSETKIRDFTKCEVAKKLKKEFTKVENSLKKSWGKNCKKLKNFLEKIKKKFGKNFKKSLEKLCEKKLKK